MDNKAFVKELMQLAFSTILTESYNGFLLIDKDGIILYANQWYFDFMDLDDSIIGKEISSIFGKSKLKNCMLTGKIERNVVDTRFKKPMLAYRFPLYKNGTLWGAVSFFNELESIEKQDVEIRQQLAQKGLTAKYTFDNIVTANKELEQLKSIARIYASSDAPVLITGESGTGKEIFAQSIHNASARKDMPFVALNCATLTESMLESELFGYEEGAFTGAKKGGKIGLFQTAHKGTILLDEIAEIPVSFQTKLLRVLQEKQIRPIGSNNQIPVDVRVIASTNQNLEDAINQGTFRLDLYYRLNVLNLRTIPLRERPEDIEVFSRFFFAYTGNVALFDKYQDRILPILKQLEDYSFPGNIRELQNILERISLLAQNDMLVGSPDELLKKVIARKSFIQPQDEISKQDGFVGNKYPVYNLNPLETEEKQRIAEVLQKNKNDKQLAANELGISIATLYRRLKKYQMK